MLRLILILVGLGSMALTMAMIIRYGLKGAFAWDERICLRRQTNFRGYRRHFRIPSSIGVIPEFFYFLILGRNNYFNARWWSLRIASYLSFMIFLAALFNRSELLNYYSVSYYADNGILALFTSGSTFWYLNMVHVLYLLLFVFICIESIRMHAWWSPVRILFYSVLSLFMVSITLITLVLIIAVSLLYLAYKIIRWFMKSNRRIKVDHDDDDEPREKLNNRYRIFRAELYEWERERKLNRKARKPEDKKPVIKRKRKKIVRKPALRNDDYPRIYPD